MSPPAAFVVGGASGIGAATARRLAEEGYVVAIGDIYADGAVSVADELVNSGRRAFGLGVDVTDSASVSAAVAQIGTTAGTATKIFTAVGIMRVSPFLDLGQDDWNRTISVNLGGTFRVLQQSAKAMVDEGLTGSMVAVASVAARSPRPDAADYAASKAGILSLVASSAVALAPHGIRVNAICPGVVQTPMTEANAARRAEAQGSTPEQELAELVARVPLGRMASPEEVASVAACVLGDDFSYVTGQAINVCGGLEFN